jgi:hypothetical protein
MLREHKSKIHERQAWGNHANETGKSYKIMKILDRVLSWMYCTRNIDGHACDLPECQNYWITINI